MSYYRTLIKRERRGILRVHKKGQSPSSHIKFLVLMSFLVPILLLLPAFIYAGIFPFGDQTTLAVDLRNQYIGFFEAYKHVFSDFGSLLYNFTKGPGGLMSATDAYYLMSPLNFLFFLFPSAQMPLAVELIQVLKIGLSGAFFALFLSRREHGDDWRTLLFASFYALMSFSMANLLNVMWLDVLYMAPLVLLYLERLLDGKSPIPYILLLLWTILMNFYMAYMLCVFLGFYALWSLIRRPRPNGMKSGNWIKTCVQKYFSFVLFSGIAVAMSAWLLLPNLYSLLLSKGPYQDQVVAKATFQYPLADPLSRLIPFAFDYDQVSNGYANIYSGTLCTILLFFYFFNARVSVRERITSFLLTAFLLVSMNFRLLNVFWHGFQYPIWYNYRFSWIFCLFTVLLAFRGFMRMRRVSLVQLSITLVSFVALLGYLAYRKYTDDKAFSFLTLYHLAGTFVLAIVYLVLLVRWTAEKKMLRTASFMLLLFSLLEISGNACVYTACFTYEGRTEFAAFHQNMQQALEDVRPKANTFYRVEKTFMHDSNDGMRFGISGLTHFNSTYEFNTIELLSSLGFSRGRASTTGGNATKFTDAFFGIRYYLAGKDKENTPTFAGEDSVYKPKTHRPDIQNMTLKTEHPWIRVYENPWCMPFGMVAEKELGNFEIGRKNPIDLQDYLANMLDGKAEGKLNYFVRRPLEKPQFINLKKEEHSTELATYRRISSNKDEHAQIKYKVHTSGNASAYMTISETFNSYNSFVFLNNKQIENKRSGSVSTSQVLNVSAANESEKTQDLTIQMHRKKDSFRLNHVALFELDENALKDAVAYQKKNGLHLTSFHSTAFSGTFEATENTPYLLLTLPYDEGWSAKLDGRSVPTKKVLNALTAISVTPGTHKLEMEFHTPMLWEGCCLSLAGLMFLFVLIRNERQSKARTVSAVSVGHEEAL